MVFISLFAVAWTNLRSLRGGFCQSLVRKNALVAAEMLNDLMISSFKEYDMHHEAAIERMAFGQFHR